MRVPSSTRSVSSPTAALPSQPRPTRQRPCRFVGFRTRSVPISSLFLVIFLTITITPSRCVVGHLWHPGVILPRTFVALQLEIANGVCQRRVSLVVAPNRDSCFRTSHPWIPLLKVVVAGRRQRDTVTTPITTSSSASERSTTSTSSHVRGPRHTWAHHPLPFSFLALDADAHDARGHALPLPQSLPCVSVRVWPSFCVSLEEMPFDGTFFAMRTSNGVRPGSVSKFLCHILPIMLITFHSWISGDPL